MTIAARLARFVTSISVDDMPPLALERAQMSIASSVASAALGQGIASVQAIRAIEQESGGAAQSTVWFDGGKLPAPGAARVNAVASDAAASDDSDMRSIAHIGTIVSAASIAMAERLGRGGADVLTAMVLGYEVAGRIDEALTPGRMQRGFHGSVSTIFGAAVAGGRLLALSEAQMTHAIALAATSIGGLAIAADTSCAREYHASLSAMLGIHAALAAARGFTAEPNSLEAPRGFFHALGGQALEDVTAGLGESWDIVTDMAIKLMPGGHPFHAIAEAAASAAIEGDVDPREVERRHFGRADARLGQPVASARPDRRGAQCRLLCRSIGGGPPLWLGAHAGGENDRSAHHGVAGQGGLRPRSRAPAGPLHPSPRRNGVDSHAFRPDVYAYLQGATRFRCARRRMDRCRCQVSSPGAPVRAGAGTGRSKPVDDS